jgi:hypothetical protein
MAQPARGTYAARVAYVNKYKSGGKPTPTPTTPPTTKPPKNAGSDLLKKMLRDAWNRFKNTMWGGPKIKPPKGTPTATPRP